MPKYVALVPAAGTGMRMGEAVPKQYRILAGRPMLYHAVSALSDCDSIDAVFVVLAPADTIWASWPWDEFGARLTPLYCGGATRAASVLNGLCAIRDQVADDHWVLVHDAARPCLRQAHLRRLVSELSDDPVGGLLAVPVADTLKRADAAGRVARTEPRDGLWQAQTPQMFRYRLLVDALARLPEEAVTDEAGAVEALGLAPRLVTGDMGNLKVTYPHDLPLAERLLQEGELSEDRNESGTGL